MKKISLFWYIFPAFLAITLFSLAAASLLAARSSQKLLLKNIETDLLAKAVIAEKLLEGDISADRNYINNLCRELAKGTELRITVILADGTVIGDTLEDPAKMDNHASRPEFSEALAGGTGISSRYSDTIAKNLIYVAIPVISNNETLGAVRMSIPVLSVKETLKETYLELLLSAFVIAIAATVIVFLISLKISRPLAELKNIADSLASGNLEPKMNIYSTMEIAGLAQSMNRMAENLSDRIRDITRQKNEQQAVLSSMTEGVLALDINQSIISMNSSAKIFLGLENKEWVGKSIQEVVRNAGFLELVDEALSGTELVEGEFILRNGEQRHIQLHSAMLKDENNGQMGAVIVMNDITRLYKLENLRQDFVANVSHELKTPVTAIKGFIETLIDGALDDPIKSQEFLDIISRQADRLNAIISDLLTLSRIEADTGKSDLHSEESILEDIVRAAVQSSLFKIDKKNIRVEFSSENRTLVLCDPQLLEQAVINLLDNAIKYSSENGVIRADIIRNERSVSITISDEGCGIEKEHLPRLFERFYRADKARSRKLGGTGLGLAIVKHIAQAHGGSVGVESEPGKGSAFSITLPLS